MFRLAWLALVAAWGCSTTDDRPLTIQYLTESVLAPTCGTAQCHSIFADNLGKHFDTVDGARYSLLSSETCGGGTRNFMVRLYKGSDPGTDDRVNPGASVFVEWLTATDPQACGVGRMPWDSPMPTLDVDYIERWLAAGAIGAQCDPSRDGGFACDADYIVPCDDWSFGKRNDPEATHCPNGCTAVGGQVQCL